MKIQDENIRANGFTPDWLQGGSTAFLITAVMVLLIGWFGCDKEVRQRTVLRSQINASDTLQLQGLEGSGVFSDGWVGETATIALTNPNHSRGLMISGTNVQTGLKDERLTLAVSFPGGGSDSVEIRGTGDFEELFVLPVKVAERETLQLSLNSSKVFVPAKLGSSPDDRRLSFRLKKLGIVDEAILEQRKPSGFAFPREAEHEPFLFGVYKDGWFADSAIVTLHNLENKRSVEIRGFFPPNIFTKIATLEVYSGSSLLVKEQLPNRTRGYFRTLVQLPDNLVSSGRVTLTLKSSGAFVPAERGINPDRRRLSYRLEYVGFK